MQWLNAEAPPPSLPGLGLVPEDLLPGDQRKELAERGEGVPHRGL